MATFITDRTRILEYLFNNEFLIKAISICEDRTTINYEELLEYYEENGRDPAGMLVRIENGIKFGVITYEGKHPSILIRNLQVTKDWKDVYESTKFLSYKKTKQMFNKWAQEDMMKNTRRQKWLNERADQYVV